MKKSKTLPRILLVDADRSSSLRLSALLRDAGYLDVSAVATGKRALEEYSKAVPELVIIDPSLKTDSGYEVAEQLTARANGHGAPRILFLTADESEGPRVLARLLGARGVVPKPCEPDDLLKEVSAALA